ncbi:MAG TPA: FliM/FliN family flagellar motor switch protein [Candidatus Baltobacteraceae bacterium]|jgi:flagellar motor switch/type III secretory pathway protein FliN|nr:FliM/FliN family flagellar motor switch protein [Candidatus Baltobacteraceae bacterium]
MSAPLALGFERRGELIHGRHVRRPCFRRRSALPLSAACVVGNTARETLSALLRAAVKLHVSEPCIPDATAWSAIVDGALVFGMRGSLCEAAFVVRPADALALSAAAFGEIESGSRALSGMENEMLQRVLRALAPALPHLCGRDAGALQQILDTRAFATYLELIVEEPVKVRVGVALSRDPEPKGAPALRLEDLSDVEVEVRAEFAHGQIAAAEFLRLGPGAYVPMMTRMGEPGLLKLGAAALGRGECGEIGERSVIVLNASTGKD